MEGKRHADDHVKTVQQQLYLIQVLLQVQLPVVVLLYPLPTACCSATLYPPYKQLPRKLLNETTTTH